MKSPLDIYIPADEVNAAARALAARPLLAMAGDATDPPPPARSSLRVLVVEDNFVNREVARRMLGERGHLVVSVGDGEQALMEWRKGTYDLILMDIEMPVMDGPTATRLIRAEEQQRGGRIPIVALTAHAQKGTDQECREYGMDGYIAKPLQREHFANAIESLVQTCRPLRTTAVPW